MTEIDATPYLVDQIRVTIADLREAWAWLGELIEPGRDSAPIPLMTDDQRARQSELAAAERAERAYALPPMRAAARVGVIDARVMVHGLVLDTVRQVAAGEGAQYVGQRPGDAGVLDALAWLDGGPSCWTATADGVIWQAAPSGVLEQMRDAMLAAAVDVRLQRANKIARQAARDVDGEHLAPVDERCPACGNRSLQLDYVSERSLREGQDSEKARRTWSVVCISEACRCTGVGCGCRQRVRYAGRPHAWTYGELAGPHGLWAAARAARRRRRGPEVRIGSETAGHGGWADRRVPRRVGRAVRDHEGVLWWDRERACAQLGIKPQHLWDWVRRSRVEEGWPRLDPPRRDGRVSWYAAQQLLDIEWHLDQSGRGRKRPA